MNCAWNCLGLLAMPPIGQVRRRVVGRPRLWVLLGLLGLLVLSSSCATAPPLGRATANTLESSSAAVAQLRSGRRPAALGLGVKISAPWFSDDDAFAFVDGRTGVQITMTEVVRRLRLHKVIVVGEQHDQASHHELQRRVVEVLVADGPGLVVGLEMLTWDKQSQLDRFNVGEVDANGLRDAVDWKKAWGFDFNFYAPIFQIGHQGGARFIALNAPRTLVRNIRRVGLDGLSPGDRASLPELDLGDQQHRVWFERIFSGAGHALKPTEVDAFYRAQVLWDESMAERAAAAINDGARQVVVLAGAGHVANGRGIPQRVERRLGLAVLAVVPLSGVDGSNIVDTLEKAVGNAEADILVVPRFEAEIRL